MKNFFNTDDKPKEISRTCYVCGGKGTRMIKKENHNSYYMVTCFSCNGTGKLYTPKL